VIAKYRAQSMEAFGEFRIRPATTRDGAMVRELVFGVLIEYGLQPDRDGTDADLDDIERTYHRRGGTFDVVEDADGRLVGTVGLYATDAETFELRKMYLVPAARGRGLGKWLLARSLRAARSRGAKRVTLETASALTEAIALYRAFGFRPLSSEHLAARCDQAYVLDLED